jgi:hypothetical protein
MGTEVSDQVQWSLKQVEDEFLHICQQVLPSDNSPTAALGVTALPALAEEIGAGLRAMGVAEAVIESSFRRAAEDLQQSLGEAVMKGRRGCIEWRGTVNAINQKIGISHSS